MSVTPTQLMNSIPVEVGDAAAGGIVAANIAVIWGQFAYKSLDDTSGYLQYLFALRKAYDYIISFWASQPDQAIDGFRISYTQVAERYEAKQKDLDMEIAAYELALADNYPVAQQMTRQAPIQIGDIPYPVPVPATGPAPIDANDASVQGSPYYGTWPAR